MKRNKEYGIAAREEEQIIKGLCQGQGRRVLYSSIL